MSKVGFDTRLPLLVGCAMAMAACDDNATVTPDAAAEVVADTAGHSDSAGGGDTAGGGTASDDFAATAADFDCILGWTKVRGFYLDNRLGRLDEAIAVAESPNGGTYPPGTILQLIPFEAMVKRAPGWSAATNDWEFFSLQATADGTTILDRGTAAVINQFGLGCLACHGKAEAKWDFVCEQGHGCDPLGLTPALIEAAQNGDPRCR